MKINILSIPKIFYIFAPHKILRKERNKNKTTMTYKRLIYISALIFTAACSTGKYIREVPYHYSTDSFRKAAQAHKDSIDAKYTESNYKDEQLSDEEIRLKEKYSIILKMMPQDIRNYPLYTYIDAWIGTPYKPQSLDKKTGVDASYFVQALFSDVYKETFPKTADGIFRSKSLQLFTGRDFLKEGDILFFRYSKEQPISDVGIYLHNDRILACTEEGLNIYDFNDPYFQLRYVAAGRLKQEKKK